MSDLLDLYDYRIRVAAMYRVRNRAILANENAEVVCKNFRAARDELFASHPQSALDEEQRARFEGLRYFPYNPAMRVVTEVDTQVEPAVLTVPKNAEESMTMTRVARLHFTLAGQQSDSCDVLAQYLWWGPVLTVSRYNQPGSRATAVGVISSIPSREAIFYARPAASGLERIVLDFNYAYNPSCAYNSRWVCPLAPVENRLNIAIPAGEQNFSH